MKPDGLVLAASTTSHTLMFMRSHISASSFTRPMFTARNVFSSSFTISATRVELTGTMVWIAALRREREKEVDARLEALRLEHRLHHFIRRPRVGRRLEHDQHARMEML